MMNQLILFVVAFLLLGHGLIHLMGFLAYWPAAQLEGLPYKTTVLNGRFDLGITGTRLYSLAWLMISILLIVSTLALWSQQSWWLLLMMSAMLISFLLCLLDWQAAYLGALFSGFALVVLLLILGLRVEPQPFDSYPQPLPPIAIVPLPDTLPPPVHRFYKTIGDETLPHIETAVITARGTTRLQGIPFPARLRFIHEAGQGYRHYIETTYYGRSLLQVNEWYLDGEARLALPFGTVEHDPNVNLAANLGLWGESLWLPTIFLTDPRVRWEAVNDTTAQLIVPSTAGEETFTVSFDPQTGLLTRMEVMRYRDPEADKILWTLDVLAWKRFNGLLIPATATATWADERNPWLVVNVEDVAYNVYVADYIRAEGP